MIRRTKVIMAAVAAIAVLSLGQPSRAGIVSQNGLVACGATGQVDVIVAAVPPGECGPNFIILKFFNDVVVHEMNLSMVSEETYSESIGNFTDSEWKDFHISFEIPLLVDLVDVELNYEGPEADIKSTQEMIDDLAVIEFWIFFDQPLLFGESFGVFGSLTFEGVTGPLEVTLTQHPSVSEPGSLALFATGLAVLAFIGCRRRRSA